MSTPRLELCGATDALLEALVPAVRNGEADADPSPYGDPMSLYGMVMSPNRKYECEATFSGWQTAATTAQT